MSMSKRNFEEWLEQEEIRREAEERRVMRRLTPEEEGVK